ncbi:hypothetical protein DPMN_087255 [Dreissena polymorpha]|uniref:Uncharacterized protein n=1 Tax=Dreissena polymorpha TaxID=45954 RepID=A0A9D4KSC5_DREPO|nr:hypothetical protein DPMN_087255 [Dreissena polymorpha]
MVITIIDKLMSLVKDVVLNVETVYFWTDSTSSYYRNKTMFDLIGHLEERFGVTASWHYFEAGHGKGPCNGVGNIAKKECRKCCETRQVLIIPTLFEKRGDIVRHPSVP